MATNTTTTTTSKARLTKEQWDDVRDLAATVTGYTGSASIIHGQTTPQIVRRALAHIDTGDYGEATDLLNALILREAFNTFVGVEAKKRLKAQQ